MTPIPGVTVQLSSEDLQAIFDFIRSMACSKKTVSETLGLNFSSRNPKQVFDEIKGLLTAEQYERVVARYVKELVEGE